MSPEKVAPKTGKDATNSASDFISDDVTKVVQGNRLALAKIITLLESKLSAHRTAAETALTLLMAHAGRSIRTGISGPPGVGKSTFIEALGLRFLAEGRKVAVLAVDPSSPVTGGSILGDKTRMDQLARDPRAFVRPSPSSGNLGGVTRHTREAIVACEAAGFDTVIVETVGVGQSEVVVASMVDVFVAMQLPNSGDELQGIKKGILELADLVVVNKADGNLLAAAKMAKADLERAISLVRSADQIPPKVLLTSCKGDMGSTGGAGIAEVAGEIVDIVARHKKSADFNRRRTKQAVDWFRSELGEQLRDRLDCDPKFQTLIAKAEASAAQGKVPGSIAARKLVDDIFTSRG